MSSAIISAANKLSYGAEVSIESDSDYLDMKAAEVYLKFLDGHEVNNPNASNNRNQFFCYIPAK